MLKFEVIPAAQVPDALFNRHRSDDWDALAEKLQDIKVGDTIRIPLDALKGKSIENKRLNLAKALVYRKLDVMTGVLGAHLWVRVRTDADPQRKQKTK